MDLAPHLHPELRVEVGERLVHQERLRLPHEGSAHRDPLSLPTGERARLALQEVGDLERLGRLADPSRDLLLRELPVPQPEREVVLDRHVGIERVVLEHHRDVALLRRQVVHDPVADPDLAFADLLEPREHPERRRLAAARRSHEDHELAVLDLEIEILDGPGAVVVDLRHAVIGDLCHGEPPRARSLFVPPGTPTPSGANRLLLRWAPWRPGSPSWARSTSTSSCASSGSPSRARRSAAARSRACPAARARTRPSPARGSAPTSR